MAWAHQDCGAFGPDRRRWRLARLRFCGVDAAHSTDQWPRASDARAGCDRAGAGDFGEPRASVFAGGDCGGFHSRRCLGTRCSIRVAGRAVAYGDWRRMGRLASGCSRRDAVVAPTATSARAETHWMGCDCLYPGDGDSASDADGAIHRHHTERAAWRRPGARVGSWRWTPADPLYSRCRHYGHRTVAAELPASRANPIGPIVSSAMSPASC